MYLNYYEGKKRKEHVVCVVYVRSIPKTGEEEEEMHHVEETTICYVTVLFLF